MLALVTGAHGFLGRALTRALLAAGHRVRGLVHTAPGEALDPRAELEIIHGDVTDPDAMRRAARGCDLVYHLAGIRRGIARDTFFSVNTAATRTVLEACLAAGAARQRFVLAGSLAAMGPSREGHREGDPFAPTEWYGESKAEAERIAWDFRDRLPIAVARPPRIMGPGDRENLFFFRLAAKGIVLRILGPERPLSWIDVDDCAKGLLLLGQRPEAIGQAFFLASRERSSVTGLQRAIAQALALDPTTVPVPPALLSALAWSADGLSRILRRKLPLNRKLARQVLAPGWTCHTDKAERLLGFTAPTSLACSIARSAAAYRERGWL